jgi:hypothetical protein
MATPHPPEIDFDARIGATLDPGIFVRSRDSAKYVIGRARFQRPTLSVPKGDTFEWPNGVEGLRIQGSIGNARHKYIGDNADVVQVMHRDSRTIEMSGMFTGITASANVRALMAVITAVSPTGYWILSLPPGGDKGVITQTQQVNIDNYEFDHAWDDRTDSWNYTITFIRVGIGKKITPPKNVTTSPKNPGTTRTTPRGTPSRVFTIHAGGRTLRAAAQLVYHNPERWKEIYNKNLKVLNSLNIPLHILPTKNLPLGLKLHY